MAGRYKLKSENMDNPNLIPLPSDFVRYHPQPPSAPPPPPEPIQAPIPGPPQPVPPPPPMETAKPQSRFGSVLPPVGGEPQVRERTPEPSSGEPLDPSEPSSASRAKTLLSKALAKKRLNAFVSQKQPEKENPGVPSSRRIASPVGLSFGFSKKSIKLSSITDESFQHQEDKSKDSTQAQSGAQFGTIPKQPPVAQKGFGLKKPSVAEKLKSYKPDTPPTPVEPHIETIKSKSSSKSKSSRENRSPEKDKGRSKRTGSPSRHKRTPDRSRRQSSDRRRSNRHSRTPEKRSSRGSRSGRSPESSDKSRRKSPKGKGKSPDVQQKTSSSSPGVKSPEKHNRSPRLYSSSPEAKVAEQIPLEKVSAASVPSPVRNDTVAKAVKRITSVDKLEKPKKLPSLVNYGSQSDADTKSMDTFSSEPDIEHPPKETVKEVADEEEEEEGLKKDRNYRKRDSVSADSEKLDGNIEDVNKISKSGSPDSYKPLEKRDVTPGRFNRSFESGRRRSPCAKRPSSPRFNKDRTKQFVCEVNERFEYHWPVEKIVNTECSPVLCYSVQPRFFCELKELILLQKVNLPKNLKGFVLTREEADYKARCAERVKKHQHRRLSLSGNRASKEKSVSGDRAEKTEVKQASLPSQKQVVSESDDGNTAMKSKWDSDGENEENAVPVSVDGKLASSDSDKKHKKEKKKKRKKSRQESSDVESPVKPKKHDVVEQVSPEKKRKKTSSKDSKAESSDFDSPKKKQKLEKPQVSIPLSPKLETKHKKSRKTSEGTEGDGQCDSAHVSKRHRKVSVDLQQDVKLDKQNRFSKLDDSPVKQPVKQREKTPPAKPVAIQHDNAKLSKWKAVDGQHKQKDEKHPAPVEPKKSNKIVAAEHIDDHIDQNSNSNVRKLTSASRLSESESDSASPVKSRPARDNEKHYRRDSSSTKIAPVKEELVSKKSYDYDQNSKHQDLNKSFESDNCSLERRQSSEIRERSSRSDELNREINRRIEQLHQTDEVVGSNKAACFQSEENRSRSGLDSYDNKMYKVKEEKSDFTPQIKQESCNKDIEPLMKPRVLMKEDLDELQDRRLSHGPRTPPMPSAVSDEKFVYQEPPIQRNERKRRLESPPPDRYEERRSESPYDARTRDEYEKRRSREHRPYDKHDRRRYDKEPDHSPEYYASRKGGDKHRRRERSRSGSYERSSRGRRRHGPHSPDYNRPPSEHGEFYQSRSKRSDSRSSLDRTHPDYDHDQRDYGHRDRGRGDGRGSDRGRGHYEDYRGQDRARNQPYHEDYPRTDQPEIPYTECTAQYNTAMYTQQMYPTQQQYDYYQDPNAYQQYYQQHPEVAMQGTAQVIPTVISTSYAPPQAYDLNAGDHQQVLIPAPVIPADSSYTSGWTTLPVAAAAEHNEGDDSPPPPPPPLPVIKAAVIAESNVDTTTIEKTVTPPKKEQTLEEKIATIKAIFPQIETGSDQEEEKEVEEEEESESDGEPPPPPPPLPPASSVQGILLLAGKDSLLTDYQKEKSTGRRKSVSFAENAKQSTGEYVRLSSPPPPGKTTPISMKIQARHHHHAAKVDLVSSSTSSSSSRPVVKPPITAKHSSMMKATGKHHSLVDQKKAKRKESPPPPPPPAVPPPVAPTYAPTVAPTATAVPPGYSVVYYQPTYQMPGGQPMYAAQYTQQAVPHPAYPIYSQQMTMYVGQGMTPQTAQIRYQTSVAPQPPPPGTGVQLNSPKVINPAATRIPPPSGGQRN